MPKIKVIDFSHEVKANELKEGQVIIQDKTNTPYGIISTPTGKLYLNLKDFYTYAPDYSVAGRVYNDIEIIVK